MATRTSLRIFKSWGVADERNAWVNNYEFKHVDLALTDSRFETVAQTILAAERAIHLPGVQFWQMTWSTWEEDSQPYNPDSFRTIPLAVAGQREAGTSNALDSNVCFFVRKEVATGRVGKLFYRGCLVEADVNVGGDLSYSLEAGSQLAAAGAAWDTYHDAMVLQVAAISDPFGDGNPNLALLGRNKAGTLHERFVTELVPSGIVINRRSHRWFNRATT